MKTKCINLIAVLVLVFAFNAHASSGWNGDGGNNGNDGHNGGGGWNGDNGDNGNGGYQVERQILCESIDHNPAACTTGLDRTQNIYLARQISDAPCVEGSTYSFYRDRINVGGGCRGYFIARGVTHEPLPTDKVIGGGHDDGGNGHPGQQVSYKILCESYDRPVACRIPLRRVYEAYLYNQLSKNACVEGYSYRINRKYIEVARGCRATFIVTGID